MKFSSSQYQAWYTLGKKAKQSFQSALDNLNAKRFDSSIIDSYRAAYLTAAAYMCYIGKEDISHRAVSEFVRNDEVVKKVAPFGKAFVNNYRWLADRSYTATYGTEFLADERMADKSLAFAREGKKIIDELTRKTIEKESKELNSQKQPSVDSKLPDITPDINH